MIRVRKYSSINQGAHIRAQQGNKLKSLASSVAQTSASFLLALPTAQHDVDFNVCSMQPLAMLTEPSMFWTRFDLPRS